VDPTGTRSARFPRAASFARRWWAELVTVHPHRGQHWGAAQVGLSVVVPLVLVVILGRVELSAYAAFGALSSVYGGRRGRRDRLRAQVVVGAALTLAVVLGVVASSAPGTAESSVLACVLVSGAGVLVSRTLGYLPVPSLFLVLAAGTVSAAPHTWSDLPVAAAVAALAATFGVVVGQLSLGFQRDVAPALPAPAVPLGTALAVPGARSELVFYLLSPGLAGGLAHLLAFGHPYWAAVAALVPLAGRGLAAQLGRATLRFAGTVAGLGVGFLLIAPDPSAAVLLVAIAALQVLTELFVTRHYGIAVVFITPMTLALGHLVSPTPARTLIADRLVQTCLGVAVAVIVLLVARSASSRRGWRGGPARMG
jgi:hypothetical protein